MLKIAKINGIIATLNKLYNITYNKIGTRLCGKFRQCKRIKKWSILNYRHCFSFYLRHTHTKTIQTMLIILNKSKHKRLFFQFSPNNGFFSAESPIFRFVVWLYNNLLIFFPAHSSGYTLVVHNSKNLHWLTIVFAQALFAHTRNEWWFIRLMINCGYSTNIRSMEFRREVRRRSVFFCCSFHSNNLSTIIKNRYHWMISMHVVCFKLN